jgi:hypothetical protein
MKAAVIDSPGRGPRFADFAEPVVAEGETLVEASAAGLHPIVRMLASGEHYGSQGVLPMIPGIDGCAAPGWRSSAAAPGPSRWRRSSARYRSSWPSRPPASCRSISARCPWPRSGRPGSATTTAGGSSCGPDHRPGCGAQMAGQWPGPQETGRRSRPSQPRHAGRPRLHGRRLQWESCWCTPERLLAHRADHAQLLSMIRSQAGPATPAAADRAGRPGQVRILVR